MRINAPHDTEIQHVVTDAKTNEVVPFLINTDHHGMTVEFPNGQFITLDLSGGVVSVYHNVDGEDTGTKVHAIDLHTVGSTEAKTLYDFGDPYFNDKLRNGHVTVAELIENLQRFPQNAICRINRNMLSVKYCDKLYWLNAGVPDWKHALYHQFRGKPTKAEAIRLFGDKAVEVARSLYETDFGKVLFEEDCVSDGDAPLGDPEAVWGYCWRGYNIQCDREDLSPN